MFKLPSDAFFQHLNVDVYELFKKLFYFGNHYCDSKLALQTKVLFCQKADRQMESAFPPLSARLSAFQNPQLLCAPCPDCLVPSNDDAYILVHCITIIL